MLNNISCQEKICDSTFTPSGASCHWFRMEKNQLIESIREKVRHLSDQEGQETTADVMGISQSQVSRFINEKAGLRLSSACKALERIGARIVYPGEEKPIICDMGDYALVPKVHAKLGAGSSLVTDDTPDGMYAFRKSFLKRVGLECNTDLVLFDVIGDSMLPTIQDGDTVLCSTREKDPAHGKLYAVRVNDELLCKRILKEPGRLVLKSDNEDNPSISLNLSDPDLNCEIIGRVRWQGRVWN